MNALISSVFLASSTVVSRQSLIHIRLTCLRGPLRLALLFFAFFCVFSCFFPFVYLVRIIFILCLLLISFCFFGGSNSGGSEGRLPPGRDAWLAKGGTHTRAGDDTRERRLAHTTIHLFTHTDGRTDGRAGGRAGSHCPFNSHPWLRGPAGVEWGACPRPACCP